MKRLAIAVALSVAVAAHGDTLLGEDISVPVELGVALAPYGTGLTIEVAPTGAGSAHVVTVGRWEVVYARYKDVAQAMQDMDAVVENLESRIDNPGYVVTEEGAVKVQKADYLAMFCRAMTENQAALDAALSKKWAKINAALEANAGSQKDDKEGAKKMQTLQDGYDTCVEALSSAQSKIDKVSKELSTHKAALDGQMKNALLQISDLRGALDRSGNTQAEIARIVTQLSEMEGRYSSLVMQQGVILQALKEVPTIEGFMKFLPLGGGGAFSLPPQLGTYSNQMSRLSKFVGGKVEEGEDDGVFTLPTRQIVPDSFTDGDEESGDESEESPDTITTLMRLLWEKGFVPWLPYEAEGALPEDENKMWGAEQPNGGRFFWDEQVGDKVVSHAEGIEMPEEWRLATTPWYLDSANMQWKNAHVQFGNSIDAGSGTYDAIVGSNYAMCNLAAKTITIVGSASDNPSAGVVYFFVGNVSQDGKITGGTFHTPVILMWE